MLASALDDLHMDNIVEVTKKQEEQDDVPLYLHPAPAAPNPWREAIDAELVCLHLGTADSFLDAGAALNAVVNWHVEIALDPAVSSAAKALVDRGAAAPAVPVAWINAYGVQELTFDNPALGSREWEVKRNRERGHDVPLYLHPAAPVPEEHDMADDDGCPVCGADGGTSCGMPNCGLLSAAPAVQSAAKAIAEEQSYDPSLWFVVTTVTEAHLQAALRRLTAAVEGEAPVVRTLLTDEQVWMAATQCTIGSDLHIDKFARAIEAAHGIGDKT
jgi:hypothetical protein